MFTPEQYRAKAVEYSELVKKSTRPKPAPRSTTAPTAPPCRGEEIVPSAEQDRSNGTTLAEEEKHVLQCLGAALIMQWNTLPTKLRRELFDNAAAMSELLEIAALRGQIARFLDKHTDYKELKQ
jgi:hypothetical protein